MIEQWSQHGEYCQKIASAMLVSITVNVCNYIPRITVGKIQEASGSLNFLLNTIHLKYCVKVRITTLLEELRNIGIFSENNRYENRHSYMIRRTIGGTSNIFIQYYISHILLYNRANYLTVYLSRYGKLSLEGNKLPLEVYRNLNCYL